MQCPVCKSDVVERSGKFGPFLCCPSSRPGDNHGTFSKQGPLLYFTGPLGAKLKPRLPPRYDGPPSLSLSEQIDWMTNAMLPGGMTDMDRFLERSDEAAYSRNEIDELHCPDDWRNQRPY